MYYIVDGGDPMYLNVQPDGSLTLEETNNFSRFEIRSTMDLASEHISEDFSKIAEPIENDRYWIDAEAILDLSSRADDAEWCKAFWAMLERAEPYGFADVTRKKIRSHVVK